MDEIQKSADTAQAKPDPLVWGAWGLSVLKKTFRLAAATLDEFGAATEASTLLKQWYGGLKGISGATILGTGLYGTVRSAAEQNYEAALQKFCATAGGYGLGASLGKAAFLMVTPVAGSLAGAGASLLASSAGGAAGIAWGGELCGRAYRSIADPEGQGGGIKPRFENAVAPPPIADFSAPAMKPEAQSPSQQMAYMIYFDWDKFDLTSRDAQSTLDAIALAAADNPAYPIGIAGHTDTSGFSGYNQGLSERRANAVKNELIRRGVEAGRVLTVGYGEQYPAIQTGDNVRSPDNRRAHISLVP